MLTFQLTHTGLATQAAQQTAGSTVLGPPLRMGFASCRQRWLTAEQLVVTFPGGDAVLPAAAAAKLAKASKAIMSVGVTSLQWAAETDRCVALYRLAQSTVRAETRGGRAKDGQHVYDWSGGRNTRPVYCGGE